MAKDKIKINIRELKKLEKEMKNISDKLVDEFMLEVVEKLASEFLQRVINKTPVGNYDSRVKFTTNPSESTKEVNFKTNTGKDVFFMANNKPKNVNFENPLAGKQGGTLRDGWRIGDIKKRSKGYEVNIYNSVEYARMVEYGHRRTNKKGGETKGFTRGAFMMTNTEIEMAFENPRIIDQMVDRFLKKVL